MILLIINTFAKHGRSVKLLYAACPNGNTIHNFAHVGYCGNLVLRRTVVADSNGRKFTSSLLHINASGVVLQNADGGFTMLLDCW